MVTRIHHLDSLTIDKIAAGEVIEMPASCVKELIDNALDAGATEVQIEIVLGGRELIRVTDNGCGMCKEDVLACIERHATSKITTVEDLDHLVLRGFRGEALSSIVAISQLTITSAEQSDATTGQILKATSLVAEGGVVKRVLDTSGRGGTSLEVRSLFYNVPARRKFLKSPHKDTQEISKVVTLLALSAPSVGFRLIVDGLQTLFCQPVADGSTVTRICSLFGEPFQSDSFEVHQEQDGFSLHGIIASPSQARSTRAAQYLIVNGRPVHSLPISYAVKNGYGTAIEQGKHPAFALHLTLEAGMIDINVHPQKREIRLADEEWVRVLIQEAISKTLFGSFVSSPSIDSPSTPPFQPVEYPFPDGSTFDEPLLALEEKTEEKPVALAVIGDVAVFRSSSDRMLLLDLKQAMKAIWYRELDQQTSGCATTPLLVPIPLHCTVAEAALLRPRVPLLEKLGFMVREIGPTLFSVDGLPAHLDEVDVRKLLFCIVEDGDNHGAQRNKRLASLYTASMKWLHHPIATPIAQAIFSKWENHGSPQMAPDGSCCCSYCDGCHLKEWVAKGVT